MEKYVKGALEKIDYCAEQSVVFVNFYYPVNEIIP